MEEVVISSRVNLSLLVDHINGLPKRVYFRAPEWSDDDESSEDATGEYFFDNDIPDDTPACKIKPFLVPNLKFTILYGGSTCEAPAKIIEHVPESFFSLKMPPAHLLSLGGAFPLRDKVDLIFKRKLTIFVEILECCTVEVPESLLYHILPFIWGDNISNGVLHDIVLAVGKLLARDPNPNL